MTRKGGYKGVSFREIAQAIGIKSASVHYHFPTKADLAEALVRRYTDRFLDALGAPNSAPPAALRAQFIAAFAHALIEEDKMCLCGAFGAEIAALPSSVALPTAQFFERNLAWLEKVYSAEGLPPAEARQRAETLLSALEGAMIVARSLQDPSLFSRVAEAFA